MTTISLILGDYTPMEAKEILLKMLDSKINFHNLQSLSAYVHFGKPNIESELRIRELKEAKNQVNALALKALEDNSSIEIGSTIDIAFKAKVQPEEHVQGQELVACN